LSKMSMCVLFVGLFCALSAAHVCSIESITQADSILLKATQVGGLLFLEDQFETPEGFSEVIRQGFGENVMDYSGGTNKRETFASNTLSVGTEPASINVLQHCEMAYDSKMPAYVSFGMVKANSDGKGGTSFGSVRKITQNIHDLGLEDKFRRLGVRYIRNFDGVQTSTTYTTWQSQYATDQKSDVEARLRQEGKSFSWGDDDHLHVWYTTDAYTLHPTTGEELFINSGYSNNANWFTGWSPYDQMPAQERAFHTAWGDGTEFSTEEYALMEKAHKDAFLPELPWAPGSMVVVDNFLVTHGRSNYEPLGRKMVVALGCSASGAKIRKVSTMEKGVRLEL